MLLFDMDGTLIDSNGVWKNVDREFLARRGIAYTHAYYEGVAHTILPLAAKFTKEYCHLTESCEEIIAEWMEMARDAYAHVTVKPGVRAYLKQCRAEGRRMAVVTSSVPAHCRTALEHLDLARYFENVFFAHDLGLEKRDPAIWRKAAETCGAEPEGCTVFDDSLSACRGPGPPGCGWWGCTTPSLPRMNRKCGLSATFISRALKNSCGCRSRRPGKNKE